MIGKILCNREIQIQRALLERNTQPPEGVRGRRDQVLSEYLNLPGL